MKVHVFVTSFAFFTYGSGMTTRMFLADKRKDINNVACLLGKSVLECCKSLKDGVKTNAPSCEAVADG